MIQFAHHCLLLMIFTSCSAQSGPSDLKKLEWLLGNWRGQANGADFYESWERASATELSNINYTLCNGEAIIGERGSIRLENGQIVVGGEKDKWRLTRLTDNEAVFENPEIAYARKITHRRTAEGRWQARIESGQGVIEYTLTRVAELAELTGRKATPISGRFVGVVETPEKSVPVVFDLASRNGRQEIRVSSPDNSRKEAPALRVCHDPPQLRFSLDDGGRQVEFVAEHLDDAIVGRATIGKAVATLRLRRASPASRQ